MLVAENATTCRKILARGGCDRCALRHCAPAWALYDAAPATRRGALQSALDVPQNEGCSRCLGALAETTARKTLKPMPASSWCHMCVAYGCAAHASGPVQRVPYMILAPLLILALMNLVFGVYAEPIVNMAETAAAAAFNAGVAP